MMAGERILIVDDNPTNMKLVSFLLDKRGYEVKCAIGAQEALEVLRTFRPALILMDMQMPDIDGFELTRRLKADPAMRGITIVAVTAYAMKGDEQRVRDAGCDGYLVKPIDTRTLPQAIAGYLSSGARP
jgi:CheY-like chemotaxis protein